MKALLLVGALALLDVAGPPPRDTATTSTATQAQTLPAKRWPFWTISATGIVVIVAIAARRRRARASE